MYYCSAQLLQNKILSVCDQLRRKTAIFLETIEAPNPETALREDTTCIDSSVILIILIMPGKLERT